MGEKFPLGHDLRFSESKPFVVMDENGNWVIAVTETLKNGEGTILYTTDVIIDDNPTKEEIFKVELANPVRSPIRPVVKGGTGEGSLRRPKDS